MANMRAKLEICGFCLDQKMTVCVPHSTHLQVGVQFYRSLEFDFARHLDFERFFQVFQFQQKSPSDDKILATASHRTQLEKLL